MEWELLLDKYKNLNIAVRIAALMFLATLYPAYLYWEEQGLLLEELDEIRITRDLVQKKFDKNREKSAKLPELQEQLADIEEDLQKAKKILPEKVEQNELLSKIGSFEKELNIKIVNYKPGQESRPNQSLEYIEVPIQLEVMAPFPKIMLFFDRLVHLPMLTHIRDISFKVVENGGEEKEKGSEKKERKGEVVAAASLILFKSI